MTERWRSYIVRGVEGAGGTVPFALSQWAFLSPVFMAIRRALPTGGRVLDVGCGAGIFGALLSHHGFDVVGIDEDPDVVLLAREMVDFFRAVAQVEHGGAFDLSRYHDAFDLVYSLGVVEHFEREVTVQLIREQARCAPIVLVAVPSRFTRHAGRVTDERLYTRTQVCALVRQAGLRVRESFVYGDVPTNLARNLERALPKGAYRGLRHFLTYGMGICCVGQRR
jgi:SAM-dependent methyltransferase